MGIARAHIDLAKAEAADIADEAKQVAAWGCLAAGGLAFLGLLLPVGLVLFLGEVLFGSMGWGLFLACLLFPAIALAGVLLAMKSSGVGSSFVVGVVVGAVFGVVFALQLPNQAWRRIGEALNLSVGNGGDATPLVVGVIVIAIVFAVVGLVLGSRAGGMGAGAGFVGGGVLGAILGAYSSNTFGVGPSVATGIAVGLVVWMILMAMRLYRTASEEDAEGNSKLADDLKQRFWPQATIDTTKETIAWVRERMPLGPKS